MNGTGREDGVSATWNVTRSIDATPLVERYATLILESPRPAAVGAVAYRSAWAAIEPPFTCGPTPGNRHLPCGGP